MKLIFGFIALFLCAWFTLVVTWYALLYLVKFLRFIARIIVCLFYNIYVCIFNPFKNENKRNKTY